MAMWLKPLLDQDPAGDLAQWGLSWDWEVSERGTSLIWNDHARPRLEAEDVLKPRQWHFLAISVDGNRATLYVDGLNVAEQAWDEPLGEGRTPFLIGGNARYNHFLRSKLASFTIYPQALDDSSVGKLYVKDRDRIVQPADAVWPEDYLCLVNFAADGVKDTAELPSALVCRSGATPKMVDGRAVLDFDGKDSSVILKENPHIHLLGSPFSLIMDFNPAPGSEGCLFRRPFNPGLWLRKDGSLLFDANSGENSQIIIPNAVTAGQWNRIMVAFDGKTFSLFRDGKLIAHQNYIGGLDSNPDGPLCVGADSTVDLPVFGTHITMQLREFAIYPRPLDTMPPPAPSGESAH